MTFLIIFGIVLYIFVARIVGVVSYKHFVKTNSTSESELISLAFSIFFPVTLPVMLIFKAADFVANYDKFTVELRRKDD